MRIFTILSVIVFSLLLGCDGSSSTQVSDTSGDTDTDADTDTDTDTDTDSDSDDAGCGMLFGAPSAKSGLDETQCKPSCNCNGIDFNPPVYTEADLADLTGMKLLNPMALLESDPYQTPDLFGEKPDSVCAVIIDPDDPNAYRLETFEDAAAADNAGAIVSHRGACGMCSSLGNLAVYIGNTDLTDPVRNCGLEGMASGLEQNIVCLEEIGFDLPCAQIWAYNTTNTRTKCLTECLQALTLPYHLEDGSPNNCIQCDEDQSGPVFKAVSGRTRRNSGLPTALCRPCETITSIIHKY